MAGFTLHTEASGLLYHTADTLSLPGLSHGFSTRAGGVSRGVFGALNLGLHRGDNEENVLKNYRIFCGALNVPMERCVLSKQVHRSDVKIVLEEDAGAGLFYPQPYEADALVTNVPALPLVIFSADCIPTLYYDPVTRCIGAAHAGWRGTALGIAVRTVQTMERVYGAKAADLRAAIGPGISQCCFETDSDVPDAMRTAYGSAADAYLIPKENGKWQVDLKGLNAHILRQAGVAPEHIAVSGACTACDTSLYWSHRRVGDARGSLAAVICLR